MSKPIKYGFQRAYTPNAKADMRFRKKVYQRGREIAERDPRERLREKEVKEMEREKARGYAQSEN